MKIKRKHCVELAKLIAKTRDKFKCQRCGKTKEAGWQIHASHLKGQGAYPNLSYRTRNIMAKCSMCHAWWAEVPTESGLWFKDTFPEWYEEVKMMAREPVGQPDYDKEYELLQEELKALDGLQTVC